MKRVRIVLDPTLPMGKYRIGGVRVVRIEDDAALGRELRTVEVACHAENDAAHLREMVAGNGDLELAEQGHALATHGRHCVCSACAAEDWTNPNLAACGMHGPTCPPVYAPLNESGIPETLPHETATDD